MNLIPHRKHFAIAALALAAVTGAGAKTLVFCSEGSPENFYPGVNTTGTSFDGNEPIYNRLVEFERGGTKVVPGLAEKWDISADGKVYTFTLRKGVKWHSHRAFKPTRDMNADDILFTYERQWKEAHPFYKVTSSNHSYNDAIKDDAYDPEGAKKLLAQAGHANGFTTDLWAMPVQRPYNPNAKRIAELMQADLAKVGIKAEIKTFEWGEYRKRMQNGEHQMGMLGWTGDNGDPDNFLAVLLGCDAAKANGSNVAKFCYQPFEDLIQKAKSETKPAARDALYKQAQVVFKEQAPWFTIAHAVQLKPVRKEVVDFKLSPFGRHNFYGVDIKE